MRRYCEFADSTSLSTRLATAGYSISGHGTGARTYRPRCRSKMAVERENQTRPDPVMSCHIMSYRAMSFGACSGPSMNTRTGQASPTSPSPSPSCANEHSSVRSRVNPSRTTLAVRSQHVLSGSRSHTASAMHLPFTATYRSHFECGPACHHPRLKKLGSMQQSSPTLTHRFQRGSPLLTG